MTRYIGKNLFSRLSVLAGGRLLGAFAAFLSSLLIARYLGGEVLGTFSVFMAIIGVLSVIAAGGFPAVATIFSAEYSAKNQGAQLRGFFQVGTKQAYLGGALCFLAVAAFLFSWFPSGGVQSVWTALFIGFAIVALALTNLKGALLVGLERQAEGLLPDTLVKPVAFFLFVAVSLVAGYSLGTTGLLAGFAASIAVAFLVATYRLRKSSFMSSAPENDLPRWRRAAYPWIVTSLAWDLFIELHIIVAGFFVAPLEIAVLHVVFRFRVLAGYGMRSLYALLLPTIISAHATNDDLEFGSQIRKLNLLSFVYSCGVILFFAVAGPYLLGLFGQDFASGWPLLMVVLSTVCVRAVFGPAPAILAMKGHQKSSAIVMLGCLCLSLAGSVLLYPILGLLGIALSYAISNLVASVTLWLCCRALTGIDCSLFSALPPTNSVQQRATS
jgi:O-antigen/teichoic acid export membrane protein